MKTSSFIVLGSLVLIGVVAAHQSSDSKPAKPEVTAVEAVAAFPNVIGLPADRAKTAITEVFPASNVVTDFDRASYDYRVNNQCSWTGPDGKPSLEVNWPVSSVGLILHPEMPTGTSPIEPVQAGAKYDKRDRPYFQLHTDRPTDVSCKPYGDPGPVGGLPHVDVPNHHDHGEPWFCRHHRWC